MRLPPDDVIASWPAPDYDDPETQGSCLLAIQLILMPLALLAMLARLYARMYIMRKAWLDDWLMLGAVAVGQIFSIGTTIAVILATEVYGWKIHIWDVTPDCLVYGRIASVSAQVLYLLASGLAKMSILVSYLRIAPYDSWFRRLTVGAMPIVVVLTAAFFVVLWTQCIPTSGYWDLETEGKHCIEEGPPLIGQAAASVALDMAIYLLPLPTLRRLKLPRRQRRALVVVFSLGFVVVMAGSVRLYWVAVVVNQSYDVTWDGFRLWIWTAVEVNLGVICGCVPTLRPLFKYFQTEIRRMSGAGTCLSGVSGTQVGDGGPTTGTGGEGQVCRGGRRRDGALWFGNLNWLEGSNWLGSLGQSNTKTSAVPTAGSDKELGCGSDEHDRPGGSHSLKISSAGSASTTDMGSDPKEWKIRMAELA